MVAEDALITHDSRILFVGRLRRDELTLTVAGHAGDVVIEGDTSELDAVESFLASLDGWAEFDDVLERAASGSVEVWALVRGLLAARAAVDLTARWRDFYQLTCNPPRHGRLMLFERSYELDRWRPAPCNARPLVDQYEGVLVGLARRRRSAPLTDLTCDSPAAFSAAVQLAADAYRLHGESRPIAAGGALYPLHFWVAGEDNGTYKLFAIDHDANAMTDHTEVPVAELQAAFASDPDVSHAFSVGAAVIVIAADPRRTALKYGDRSWRYILMEVGAVTHHITLGAVELGVKIRPFGGFLDQALASILDAPPIPLLTIFVGPPDLG